MPYWRKELLFQEITNLTDCKFIMNWDIKINEEIDLLRETVRQFAEKNIFPIADEIDKKNEFPQHLWTELGKLGLLGITVPENYGGSGMSYLANLIAVEEISRASASVGLSYGAHSNLCVISFCLMAMISRERNFFTSFAVVNMLER